MLKNRPVMQNSDMITNEHLEQVTKRIVEELKIVGPSVEKPSVKMTSFGAEVNAGNFKIIIYDVSEKKLGEDYHASVAGAKDFGKGLVPDEHYHSQGMFSTDEIDVGWYLIAKNKILP